jgi:hypothetical protein
MTYQQKIDNIIDWTPDNLIEIKINPRYTYEDIRETLTRMGVKNDFKKLTQSCHILWMRGTFYIVHFKELFGLDGRDITFTQNDSNRRTSIIKLLVQWNMITIVNPESIDPNYQRVEIAVISKADRNDWVLQDKYTLNQTVPVIEAPKKLVLA